MKNIKLILTVVLIGLMSKVAFAGEGMWLPFLLKSLNESEMKTMGMKMSAEDIYSVNKGSLKDAIGHFNGGCTSEIISNEGLLLTNHHCGQGYIQRYSSLENNYLEDGFWAMSRAEEIPAEGLFVTLVSRMEDVTEQVMKGIKKKMNDEERQAVIDTNLEKVKASYQLGKFEDLVLKPFFKGNQYIAIVTVTFNDIRMVGAPPTAIGAFGKDTDNWVWPRHSGDFALFRIYADGDNNPAEYSENNKPYTPKHFLPISLDGVEEGDFTLVFGFPGRTNEYLSASAVSQIKDVVDPIRISIRDETIRVMDSYMKSDPAIKIQYASKQARISNGWKKWQGEVLGLNKSNAIGKKKAYEAEFMKAVNSKRKYKKEYKNVLSEIDALYKQLEPLAAVREYYNEVFVRNLELFRLVNAAKGAAAVFKEKGQGEYDKRIARLKGALPGFFKDYQPKIDKEIFAAIVAKYDANVPEEYHPGYYKVEKGNCGGDFNIMAQRIFDYSLFADEDKLTKFLATPPEMLDEVLSIDLAYQMADAFSAMYNEKVANQYDEINDKIKTLESTYMKAQMEVFPDKRFYPDANSTLRVHYGNVEGYEPKDAVRYHNLSYLKGIVEKHVDGDYEYDAPDKLLELYESKDFGPYGEDGKMPVCFIGSNHTTGGNSGSPAIDAHGNLIGLNFDRAWEGTMSDINYDRSICRNIMVDARYVLFIIDKFAGAKHLVDEMKLVHPKGK